jgi:hypothetical protein
VGRRRHSPSKTFPVGPCLVVAGDSFSLLVGTRALIVTRETPLNLIHIRHMETVTLAGATVLHPMSAFITSRSIDDLLARRAGPQAGASEAERTVY